MNAGIKSNNLSYRPSLAKELVVNGEQGTGLQSFESLSSQMAGTGAVAALIYGILIGNVIAYATRAELFANLQVDNKKLGIVYGDSNQALNGIYVKNGASGSGNWTLTPLALPWSFAADLAAVISAQAETAADVNGAKAGFVSLAAKLDSLFTWSNDQDQAQNNYFNNRIDSQATASQQRDSALGVRIDGVSAAQGVTQSQVTAAAGGSTNLAARIQALADAIAAGGGEASQAIAAVASDLNQEIAKRQTAIANAVANLLDSSPGTLDTLNELAAALGDDPNFASTVSTSLGNRLRVDAAQGLSAGQKAQAKANLDLQNVNNTADADKPISTAQALANAAIGVRIDGEATARAAEALTRKNTALATRADLIGVNQTIVALNQQGQAASTAILTRAATTAYNIVNGSLGVAFCFLTNSDITEGEAIAALQTSLSLAPSCTKVRLNAYVRLRNGSPDVSALPGAATDYLLSGYPKDYTLAQMGVLAGDDVRTATFSLPNPLSGSALDDRSIIVFTVESLDASNAPVAMGFSYSVAGETLPVYRRGFRKTNAGVWADMGGNIHPAVTLVRSTIALGESLQRSRDRLALVTSTLLSADTILFARDNYTPFLITAGWVGVAFGLTADDRPAGSNFDGFKVKLAVATSCATIKSTLLFRPSTAAINADPYAQTDIQCEYTVTTPARQGIVPGGGFGDLKTIWPGRWVTRADGFYLVVIEAFDVNGNPVPLGFYRTLNATGFSAARKGFYRLAATAANWSNITSDYAVAWSLIKEGYALPASGAGADVSDAATSADTIKSLTASSIGRVVSVNAKLLRGGAITEIAGDLTMPSPTTGTATSEAVTMKYLAAGGLAWGILHVGSNLAHAGVSSVVVTRVSDGLVLTEGTHYLVNYEHGAIAAINQADDATPVTVSYNWSKIRYDLIYLNTATMTLERAVGPEKDLLAVEYMPSVPNALCIPLVNVRVSSLKTHLATRIEFSDPVRLERNRAALPRSRSQNSAQKQITIIVHSDSIGSIGNVDPSSYLTPNGPSRDRATGYLEGYEDDYLSALPLYTSTELFGVDDGAGRVHTKVGFHWELAEEIKRVTGVAPAIKNLGIGGTASGNTLGGGVVPNGSEPSRLAALTSTINAATAPLVIIHFGQNEQGSTTTAANVSVIIETAKAAGAEVIVCGVPRRNGYFGAGGSETSAAWMETNRQLELAARKAGVAFMDTVPFYGNSSTGYGGIPAVDRCIAGFSNHPGQLEFKTLYKPRLAEMVL